MELIIRGVFPMEDVLDIFEQDRYRSFTHDGFAAIPAKPAHRELVRMVDRHFDALPMDNFVGVEYGTRNRAFGLATVNAGNLSWSDPEYFVQSKTLNTLYGGIKRKFAPLSEEIKNDGVLRDMIISSLRIVSRRVELDEYIVGVHMIRTIATDTQSAYPAPEGVHQDGFKCISVHLCNKVNIKCGGAANYLYMNRDRAGNLREVTLNDPGDALFIDDIAFWHDVSPFQPLRQNEVAIRDVVVLTYGRTVIH